MRLLVALDLSNASARVLQASRRIAEATASSVWLLHVAAPEPDFVGYDAGPRVVRDQVALEYRDQHRELQGHADALRAAGIDATALLIQGPTARTILAEARRLDVDLIVMGTHGHSTVFDLLIGTISHAVLRESPLPVLLIPVRSTASSPVSR